MSNEDQLPNYVLFFKKTFLPFVFTFYFIKGGLAMAFTLNSTAFDQGSLIPQKYTCDGADVSPPLAWSGVLAGTESFALIMDDPDAPMGTWDHWVLFNLPASANGLAENIKQLPAGTQVGQNSWKRNDWGGPCPPDKEHRYFFKLYALDTTLSLSTGATKKQVEVAMKGHVLGQAELMGRYDRPRR